MIFAGFLEHQNKKIGRLKKIYLLWDGQFFDWNMGDPKSSGNFMTFLVLEASFKLWTCMLPSLTIGCIFYGDNSHGIEI